MAYRMIVVSCYTSAGAVDPNRPRAFKHLSPHEYPRLTATHAVAGVLLADASNNQPCSVMRSGIAREVVDMNAEGWVAGDTLWAGSDGYPTNVRLSAEAGCQIYIGRVYNATFVESGTPDYYVYDIDVNVQVLPSIGELSNVAYNAGPEDNSRFVFHAEDSTWYVEAGFQTTTLTGNHTIAYNEYRKNVVLCDASGGDFTVTLPSAAYLLRFDFKKIDLTRNKVTIDAESTELIEDGLESVTLNLPGEAITLQSDQTQWWVS